MFPFVVALDVPRDLDAIEVRIDFDTALTDDSVRDANEVMAAYAALGAFGAMSGSNLRPSHARLALAASRVSVQHGSWAFTGAEVDPCALFVLLNMTHWVHMEVAAVRRVVVAWPENRRPIEMQQRCFPRAFEALSFDLEFEDEGRGIDVTLDFVSPQPDAVVHRVVEVMARWLLATHRGAYANASFNPSQSHVAMGPDVMSLSAHRIIWFLDQIRCDDAALDGLVNLLECVSSRIAPIRRLRFK